MLLFVSVKLIICIENCYNFALYFPNDLTIMACATLRINALFCIHVLQNNISPMNLLVFINVALLLK